MGWIGLDDTDTLTGGCTTWDMHNLLTEIENSGKLGGWRVVNSPNLVRLWPHAPRRTRGNAALSAQISVDDNSLEAFLQLLEDWFEQRFRHLRTKHNYDSASSAQPVLVWLAEQPEEEWYWQAVRRFVEPENRMSIVQSLTGSKVWSVGRIDGVVGASSAIAWRGEHDWTWEVTAWRHPNKLGKERKVPVYATTEMSKIHPTTFMNRDPNKPQTLIAPRTPCPVLYGIRAETEEGAEAAHLWLQSRNDVESAYAYRVHRTNQATGDHLEGDEYGVAIASSTIGMGGHVTLEVVKSGSRNRLVSFKEGGVLNEIARQTLSGDKFSWRGIEAPDGSVHLEAICFRDVVPELIERPLCECGSRFKRKGVGQQLQCEKCGNQTESHWVSQIRDGFGEWFEPPPSQRRHLAQPLSRKPKG